ncbi:hypothetical protein ACFSEO_00365 [Agromyces cerinus subsp. nitratus]|uniref:hypothetical protein n=1 Tax=Agromyces cerinus TaxID=33878 RepID=UPI00363D1381
MSPCSAASRAHDDAIGIDDLGDHPDQLGETVDEVVSLRGGLRLARIRTFQERAQRRFVGPAQIALRIDGQRQARAGKCAG